MSAFGDKADIVSGARYLQTSTGMLIGTFCMICHLNLERYFNDVRVRSFVLTGAPPNSAPISTLGLGVPTPLLVRADEVIG